MLFMSIIFMYISVAQGDTCHRICCGANRAFVIHIFDQANQVNINYKSSLLMIISMLGSDSYFT